MKDQERTIREEIEEWGKRVAVDDKPATFEEIVTVCLSKFKSILEGIEEEIKGKILEEKAEYIEFGLQATEGKLNGLDVASQIIRGEINKLN